MSALTVNGLPVSYATRGTANGTYELHFMADQVSLEQLREVNWRRPTVEGDSSVLPAMYGYDLQNITYSNHDQFYRVTLRVMEHYLGDVTGYQAQIDELKASNTEMANKSDALSAQVSELETQLAEMDEAVIELYDQMAAAASIAPDTATSDEEVSVE